MRWFKIYPLLIENLGFKSSKTENEENSAKSIAPKSNAYIYKYEFNRPYYKYRIKMEK